MVPPLPVMCRPVVPGEECPPVERKQDVMPNWLKVSQLPRAVVLNLQGSLGGPLKTMFEGPPI